ncbi:MAG: hypothetical protein AAB960_01225 [Patescibacteria group bacterium]
MTSKKIQSAFPYLPTLILFLVLNVIILDGIVIWRMMGNGAVLGTTSADTCPSACITRINQVAGKTTTSSEAKEYFVPLGSGTNASSDWADVTGASAYVDTGSYGKIKKATFEATIAQPVSSQKVWVRLFNATDKHPVWYSEVATDNAGPILLTSSATTLDSGNKLYQVQMKTQLKGHTSLTQSRIHITTY